MKYLLFFLAVIFFENTLIAQSETAVTKIFIVRHAEKETGKDPVLTAAGNIRAGDLMRILKNESVQKIYVSRYNRTQMTGDSMRIQLGIDTVHYTADTLCDALINTIMEHRDFGKTIFISYQKQIIKLVVGNISLRIIQYSKLSNDLWYSIAVGNY